MKQLRRSSEGPLAESMADGSLSHPLTRGTLKRSAITGTLDGKSGRGLGEKIPSEPRRHCSFEGPPAFTGSCEEERLPSVL